MESAKQKLSLVQLKLVLLINRTSGSELKLSLLSWFFDLWTLIKYKWDKYYWDEIYMRII